MGNKKPFYGWRIAIGSFFIMAMPFAIIFLSHSIFLKPVTTALGFSATEFSLVFTIVAIATAIMSPIMGKLIRKFDVKYIMAICGGIVAICFAAFGLAKELWQFYILSAILGVFATGITQIPVSYVITNWFPSEKKGVATGIAFSGGNLGAFFTIMVISNLMPKIGYEKCYFLLGFIMFIITTTVSLFVIKGKPSDVGELPYGKSENQCNLEKSNKKVTDISGYTLAEAKKSTVFWVYIVAIILLGVVFAGVQMHIPSYMESIGHSAIFASTITSIVSVMGILSNVLIGMLLEKAGLKKGMTIIGVFMILSIACLILGKTTLFAILFAVIFGGFIAIAAMGPSYLTSELFGKKEYGAILGIVIMFFQFGGAVGPTLSGFIYDTTGAYKITWIIFIALLVITFGTFLIAINLANKNKISEIQNTEVNTQI
ncbi:MFS transporter [Clostridium tarantellae]|uniref:MFS transporter n=1 Tax=Clostridium tarantellae TaxID=39493 RepID=A0A6I1MK14_9CLOT|nr:MFS transporter [Clostridium tarantellae]MPQ43294.1 MFS transporter [Clostridium tarantellae]